MADIERTFDGFFIVTTAGGDYGVYQRVDDELGLPPAANVVCMPRECFVEIAQVPQAALDPPQAALNPQAAVDPPRAASDSHRKGRRATETVRQRFRAVREAYKAMRGSAAADRAAAVNAWRQATARIGPCLRDVDAC